MKVRMSISIDEKTLEQIRDKLRTGSFRNKSHVVEYAINRLAEEKND